MTKIIGTEDMTVADVEWGVRDGGKFVIYQYCFSILIMTFRRSSSIYYIPPRGNGFLKHLPFTLISLIVGWWGIPWGFIYTPWVIISNLSGGKDVTKEVMQAMALGDTIEAPQVPVAVTR